MAVTELVSRSGVSYSIKIYALEITVTTPTGTPDFEEVATGGTSTATGDVVYWDSANSKLYVANVSGTFQDAETVTTPGGFSATISGAPANAWHASYVALARIRDQATTNQTRAVQQINDFDIPEADYIDKIAGNKDGNISATSNLVLGNAGYELLEGAFKYNLDTRIQRVRTNRDGTETQTREFEGILSQFQEVDNVGDVSTVQWQMDISDQIAP